VRCPNSTALCNEEERVKRKIHVDVSHQLRPGPRWMQFLPVGRIRRRWRATMGYKGQNRSEVIQSRFNIRSNNLNNQTAYDSLPLHILLKPPHRLPKRLFLRKPRLRRRHMPLHRKSMLSIRVQKQLIRHRMFRQYRFRLVSFLYREYFIRFCFSSATTL
jgi:hypothetical protein